jgi:hypothetical protein
MLGWLTYSFHTQAFVYKGTYLNFEIIIDRLDLFQNVRPHVKNFHFFSCWKLYPYLISILIRNFNVTVHNK